MLQAFLGHLEYVVGIVTLLGGVIAIHEFGHFICAKYVKARVDTFSIGFGPVLFAKNYNGTEYRLSVIPLGGFVKIYGQDLDEVTSDPNPKPEDSLSHKKLWERILVFIGGPLFNYILAIVIFTFMAIVGFQKLPAIATRIVAHSPAYIAGLHSGDKILQVNGQDVKDFENIITQIAENPEKTIPFIIDRNGEKKTIAIPIEKTDSLTPYGEDVISGNLDGLEAFGRAPIVGTNTATNPLGLKNGDTILAINDTPIYSWEDLEEYIQNILPKLPIALHFRINRDHQEMNISTPKLMIPRGANIRDAYEFMDYFSLHDLELFIDKTAPGSPAAKIGLRSGDRIISINHVRVYSFESLRSHVQKAGELRAKDKSRKDFENTVVLEIERAGKIERLSLAVQETRGKDALGRNIMTYTIGIQSRGQMQLPKNMLLERTWNPALALWKGLKETLEQTQITVVGMKKILFGEVSMRAVGGPIMIGKIAGEAAQRNWRDFLKIMAIISISLGVFNLLPIPILDGGHVVLALIESIRGKPIPQAAIQWTLKVGLSLLLILMAFAFYNDISHIF